MCVCVCFPITTSNKAHIYPDSGCKGSRLDHKEVMASNVGSLSGPGVAICALIHFYVHEEPQNEAGPLLTRLLTYTLRLIFQVDAPSSSLDEFVSLLEAFLRGILPSAEEVAAIRMIVSTVTATIEETTTFSGLHNYFTRIERLLLRDEMYDDVQNLTIVPAERQIDESSTFGHFLHRCLETYLSLEDDEFGKVVQQINGWIEGKADVTDGAKAYAEEEILHALRRGDYAAARAGLEGSFDRPPASMLGRSLPETLLRNAVFHVKTQAYETARASLEEALRLARGSNNVDSIAACDDLLRQIEFEERGMKSKPVLVRSKAPQSSAPVNVTHKRDFYRHIEDGTPLVQVLQAVDQHQIASHKTATNAAEGRSGDLLTYERDLMLADLWRKLGSTGNQEMMQIACSDDATSLSGWTAREQALSLALSRSASLSVAGRHAEALEALMDEKVLMSMELVTLHRWHAELMRTMHLASRQSGAHATVQAIERLRPEVVREVGGDVTALVLASDVDDVRRQPNEATFGRKVRLTTAESLMQKLCEARRLRRSARDASQSLLIAVEVMEESQQAHIFSLYRRAAVETAEGLLSLGQATRARGLLDEIMPQVRSRRFTVPLCIH